MITPVTRCEVKAFCRSFFGLVLLISIVVLTIVRTLMLNKQGIKVMELGKQDRKDFLIPPFAFFYFYLILANAFGLPAIPNQELFHNEVVTWLGGGRVFCGSNTFCWALFSFKKVLELVLSRLLLKA